jgi:hypothetical protein
VVVIDPVYSVTSGFGVVGARMALVGAVTGGEEAPVVAVVEGVVLAPAVALPEHNAQSVPVGEPSP